ncbi:unnamed protein product [Rhizophagus irregularis]|nr:unnamed protein product [Rhizophagus irregularis]
MRMQRNLEVSVIMTRLQLLTRKSLFFDLQLVFMYLILIGFFGGMGYLIFQSFFGGAKTKKGKKRIVKTEDNNSESDKFDESWLPEQHLKSQTTRSSARIRKKNEAKKE